MTWTTGYGTALHRPQAVSLHISPLIYYVIYTNIKQTMLLEWFVCVFVCVCVCVCVCALVSVHQYRALIAVLVISDIVIKSLKP